MAEEDRSVQPVHDEHEEIKQLTLNKIQELLTQLSIVKVYFIDDAINQDTGKETFKGIIRGIASAGNISALQTIQMQGIDFSNDEAILYDHIDEVWDKIRHSKQLRYFEKVYTIAENPNAINDLNISNNLKDFFTEGQIQFLTPNEWDAGHDKIISEVPDGNKILVIFDQDLKLAEGRYKDLLVQGEQLILELKQKQTNKVIISLLTHTISSSEDELPKRTEICAKIDDLEVSDFFVLAKNRLAKPEMFADGLKKVCLNTFCENIKDQTVSLLVSAQQNTIDRLKTFDTYDFDHTVFRSSYYEGVWEPETLLRITDIIFKDEVRKLMISKDYMTAVNPSICAATEVSKVEFKLEDSTNPYSKRFTLRHQEIYEAGDLLNKLRKPIDNGDIFEVIEGEKKGKKFILVAQECDLMVRGKDGNRGARTATFLEIGAYTEEQLLREISRKYKKEIENEKFNNHFFADRFKLEYFEAGKTNVGIVYFSKAIVIDLNVLDLIVFNELGEAKLDLVDSTYDPNFHNSAWQKRYDLIFDEFSRYKSIIDHHCAATNNIDNPLKLEIQVQFNYLFSFIDEIGNQLNYSPSKFDFGLKRISRLREPKSKYVMNRYYQHLSRIAEPHDFAI